MQSQPASTVSESSIASQTETTSKIELLNMTQEDLKGFFASLNEPPFRAKQVFKWLYHALETDFMEMTNLSLKLRTKLTQIASITDLPLLHEQQSQDGTRKFLFGLHDGARIESVLIPDEKRNTLCISSQVGCALACKFCYTATMGPGRNLTVAEYMGQFLGVSRRLPEDQRITNVVFMGMGEPLVNLKNLFSTLDLLTDDSGLNIGKRRITISTAGLCPQLLELSEKVPVRLAISLHATTDEQRDELMPINKRYNIKKLFETLRHCSTKKRLPVTLEYTLIDQVNDSDADARRLAKLAHSIHAKVNLIPYNEHPGAPDYKRPSAARIERFRDNLQKAHVRATKRATRGDDISAACGQLAILAEESEVPTSAFKAPSRRKTKR